MTNRGAVKDGKPTASWMADGPVMPDSGVVGGDGAGQSFSIRYTRPDIPGAIITSYWYAVDESERYLDDPDDPDARTGWDVENLNEYLICTDPTDPGGTEVWSTYEYETPALMVLETEAAAVAYAGRSARSESADHYYWNGEATA
jgi:hypothetical protein